MGRSVTIQIAGREISLETEGSQTYVQELAQFVTARVEHARDTHGTNSPPELVAALEIADELYQLKNEQRELKRQVEERTRRLLHYIEKEADV